MTTLTGQKLGVVTGASGGIGREIAKELDRLGYKVILQGRNRTKLEELKQALNAQSEVITGDLNDLTQRQIVLQRVFELGVPSLLVNAAGISEFSAFEKHSEEQIEKLITTNLLTPMLFTKSFVERAKQTLPEKTEKEVTIVNIGSVFGYIGYPGFSSYCASKFGLRGFTESLAREYADSIFRFRYFAPRATKTAINYSNVDNLNAELGNKVDSAVFVAKQFISFYQSNQREKVIGWPEKLFVRINGLLPSIVDNAIKSKLSTIRQFIQA